MPAQFTVGQQLPNGATVTADTFTTDGDGTTHETMTDSAGNTTRIATPGTGTQMANRVALQTAVQARLAQVETFIAANPNGAVLTAAQTNALARMLVALARLTLDLTTTVGQGS